VTCRGVHLMGVCCFTLDPVTESGSSAGVAMAEPVRARRLSDQEGQRLQQIVRRGKHGSVRVRRAMIIMASASASDAGAGDRPAGRRG
jgi:hypothetical protein